MERSGEEMRARLERLEREVRVLRARSRQLRWLVLAGVAAGGVFFGTQPTARRVEAAQFLNRRPALRIQAPFVVVDGAGKAILQVGADAQGRGLVLYDENEQLLCGIGTMGQGRGVAVFDAQEQLIAGLGEGRSADGVAMGRGLTVFDPAQRIVGTLGLGTNGANQGRGLSVNDESGTQVVGLGVWPQRPDRGQLVLSDRVNNILFAEPALP
jgi:hypothetical protein